MAIIADLSAIYKRIEDFNQLEFQLFGTVLLANKLA